MAYDITLSPRQRLIDDGRLCCEGGESGGDYLLQENGDFLLQETNDQINLE